MVATRGSPAIEFDAAGVPHSDFESTFLIRQFRQEERERRDDRPWRFRQEPPPPELTARPVGAHSGLLNLAAGFLRRNGGDQRVNAPADAAAMRDRAEKDSRNRRDRARRLRRRQIIEAQTGRRLPGPRGRGA